MKRIPGISKEEQFPIINCKVCGELYPWFWFSPKVHNLKTGKLKIVCPECNRPQNTKDFLKKSKVETVCIFCSKETYDLYFPQDENFAVLAVRKAAEKGRIPLRIGRKEKSRNCLLICPECFKEISKLSKETDNLRFIRL